jgi:hypothetical protein
MNYLKGLFVSGVGGLSLGRVAFWISFGIAMRNFWNYKDITGLHFFVILTFLTYLAYGKSGLTFIWRNKFPIEKEQEDDK